MISRRCTYGLQSLVYLTEKRAVEAFVPVREISGELSIPSSYLAKILADLAARHFVSSRKGPRGGVMLRSDPDRLTVRDVIVAIDGPALFENCVLGLPDCGRLTPCPMHAGWTDIRHDLSDGFAALSIARLAELLQHSAQTGPTTAR
jgi:Rrf2 family protein